MSQTNTQKTVLYNKLFLNKHVIVDTSSMLVMGTKILDHLHDCTIVIPAIVIKELEGKRTHHSVGVFAREWLRLIESICDYPNFDPKQTLIEGYNNITVRIEHNCKNQQSLPEYLRSDRNDSTILAVAVNIGVEQDEQTTLLTNDTPMRIFTKIDPQLNVLSADISALRDPNIKPWAGVEIVSINDTEYAEISDKINSKDRHTDDTIDHIIFGKLSDETLKSGCFAVELYHKNNNPRICTIIYVNNQGHIIFGEKHSTIKPIASRTIEQAIAIEYLKADAHNSENYPQIVSLAGRAGTGKTCIAVAAGLNAIQNLEYNKIIVLKSVHEFGKDQEIGFLPGNLEEKMSVWSGAIDDAIETIVDLEYYNENNGRQPGSKTLHSNQRKQDIEYLKKQIEVHPVTYLRGRSLHKSFIIIDEAQNFSYNELLNILTRVGTQSKVVLTFDANQVDNKYLRTGKHADIWSVIQDMRKYPVFAHITLQQTERSHIAEIAAEIIEKSYDQ